jgi:hypothetical protein
MRKLILLFVALTFLLLCGCQFVDQSRVHDPGTDQIPWNTRAAWEGGALGVPY